jgi:hypothetical protein
VVRLQAYGRVSCSRSSGRAGELRCAALSEPVWSTTFSGIDGMAQEAREVPAPTGDARPAGRETTQEKKWPEDGTDPGQFQGPAMAPISASSGETGRRV